MFERLSRPAEPKTALGKVPEDLGLFSFDLVSRNSLNRDESPIAAQCCNPSLEDDDGCVRYVGSNDEVGCVAGKPPRAGGFSCALTPDVEAWVARVRRVVAKGAGAIASSEVEATELLYQLLASGGRFLGEVKGARVRACVREEQAETV